MGAHLITLDTSGLVAILHRHDPQHRAAMTVLRREAKPLLVPAATLGEVAYFIERRAPGRGLDTFLGDFADGRYTLDCGDQDLPRVRELVRRYADLPLGLVDAAVIACAERNGGRVLTFDLRHFGVVARQGTITILP